MNKLLLCLVVLVFSASGCFWPFSSGKPSVVRASVDTGVSVEMLNVSALQKVKKIYFEPLSAGAQAEASDALDRLALMIIKGFSDASDARGGRFVLVSGDDVSSADVVIKGHIEELKVRGQFKKMALMKIRADVRSVSENEVLALIYAQREVKSKGKNVDQAAYSIGFSIAEKLLE
jgi:hypothetical protein